MFLDGLVQPVYPTVVESTPGCLRSDSAGSQKHPMPNVASRIACNDDEEDDEGGDELQ